LAIVQRLLKQRKIFLSISSEKAITLEIEDEAIEAEAKRTAIAADELKSVLVTQISRMLLICLDNEQDEYIEMQYRTRPYLEEIPKDEINKRKSVLRTKLELVNKQLIDDRLKERYQFKKLAKADTFIEADWELKVKHSDRKNRSASPYPYATIQIKYQINKGDRSFLFGPTTVESKEIDFTLEELEYMENLLKAARNGLNHLAKEIQHG